MKITRQIAADKIAHYLHGKLSQAELVDWADRAMMDADSDLLTLPSSDCAGKTAKNFFAGSATARR